MAWIKFDKDLVDDPRILRAAEVLAERYTMSIENVKGEGFSSGYDIDERDAVTLMRNAVTGALVALWVYADTHIRAGDELPISALAVDRMVGIDGFCEVVGEDWIRSDNFGTTVILPGYCEKNGLISKDKRKSSNADRQRRYRERHRQEGDANTNAVSNAVTRNAVTLLDLDQDQDITTSTTFASFWDSYPKKTAKQDALKAFKKLRLVNGDFQKVMAALEMAKQSEQWQRDSGKFIPHASTWLNGRRFEDEQTEAPKIRIDL